MNGLTGSNSTVFLTPGFYIGVSPWRCPPYLIHHPQLVIVSTQIDPCFSARGHRDGGSGCHPLEDNKRPTGACTGGQMRINAKLPSQPQSVSCFAAADHSLSNAA